MPGRGDVGAPGWPPRRPEGCQLQVKRQSFRPAVSFLAVAAKTTWRTSATLARDSETPTVVSHPVAADLAAARSRTHPRGNSRSGSEDDRRRRRRLRLRARADEAIALLDGPPPPLNSAPSTPDDGRDPRHLGSLGRRTIRRDVAKAARLLPAGTAWHAYCRPRGQGILMAAGGAAVYGQRIPGER